VVETVNSRKNVFKTVHPGQQGYAAKKKFKKNQKTEQ
jgi:hypothetical protein